MSEFRLKPKNKQVYTSKMVLSLVTLLWAVFLFKFQVEILQASLVVKKFGFMIFFNGAVYLIFIPIRLILRRVCI